MSSPRQQLHEYGLKVTRQLADEIVEEIRTSPRTPYDPLESPHLRDAFHVVPNGDGADIVATAKHWKFVEFGHRTRRARHGPSHGQQWVPAQPYLRPAIAVVLAKHRRES